MRRVTTPRTGEILDRLQGADVEVLDLFSEFNNARLQNTLDAERPLYLAQDTHWSPAGAELAAKAAARRLTELGWIETGSIDYTERLAPVQRLGDLVRMLQSPILERSLASEAVPARQVVREESSEIYKDQAEAEILVLGDSFMRIFQDDAPKGAGFIAHLAKELKQPLISLINDGGGSTLVREEVSARPIFLANKKIVIWEFVERDFGIGLKGWRHIRLPPPMTASKSDL
jgi:hypothetical protein